MYHQHPCSKSRRHLLPGLDRLVAATVLVIAFPIVLGAGRAAATGDGNAMPDRSEAPLVGIANSDRAAGWYGPVHWVTWLQALTGVLHDQELSYGYVDDQELASGQLGSYALLIFPTNPVLTEAEVAAVERFVERGGRVLAFWETGAYDEAGRLRKDNALKPVLHANTYGQLRTLYDDGVTEPGNRAEDHAGYLEATLDGAALFAGLPSLLPLVALEQPVMLAGPTGQGVVMASWLAADQITRPAPPDRNAAAIAGPQSLYIGYNLLAAAAGEADRVHAAAGEAAGGQTAEPVKAWARQLLANAVRLALGEEAQAEARRALTAAREALDQAEAALRAARQKLAFVPYGEIERRLSEAQELVSRAEDRLGSSRFEEARALAIDARYRAEAIPPLVRETRPVGVRGAWMGAGNLASLGGRSGVRYFLDQLQAAGINTLFPEIVRRGVALFWTKVGYRDPAISSWDEDPLRVLVEEAHARGMQVHPWVWVFNVGTREETPAILRDHPDWREISQRGELFAPPSGSSWLNPSHPEVRQYLQRLFLEIATEYPIDGLHLDYIRYPENTTGSVFGYSPASLSAFQEKYGLDPRTLRPGSREAALWDEWRRENVTSFVHQLAVVLKEARPDLLLSAAVVPEAERARATTMQDWKRWLDEGYVDFLVTMAYSSNEPLFERYLSEIDAATGADALGHLIFPGLAVWVNSPEALAGQVAMAWAHNSPGEVFFATDYLSDNHRQALRQGFYSQPGLSPLADPEGAAALLLANLAAKIDFFQQIGALDEAGAKGWQERREKLIGDWLAAVEDHAGKEQRERSAARFATAKPATEVGKVDPSQFRPNRYWAQVSLQRDFALATRFLRWAEPRLARLLSRPQP